MVKQKTAVYLSPQESFSSQYRGSSITEYTANNRLCDGLALALGGSMGVATHTERERGQEVDADQTPTPPHQPVIGAQHLYQSGMTQTSFLVHVLA